MSDDREIATEGEATESTEIEPPLDRRVSNLEAAVEHLTAIVTTLMERSR